jgi:23S rRNA pseudouridine2604 synthase
MRSSRSAPASGSGPGGTRIDTHRPGRPPRASDPAPPGGSPEGVRLSKRMSELGLASRREADEWIEQGLVRVDGRVVSQLGARVRPDQQITIDERASRQQSLRVTVLLNKPIGYVSGQAEDGHEPAIVLVTEANHWPGDRSGLRFSLSHLRHLAPAGRLDIDSVGLLVLTQDGRIAKRLIGQGSDVEKEYLVRVRWTDEASAPPGAPMQTFPAERLALLRHGLSLDGEALAPAKVSWQNEDQLRFVLREGKKRQIRRMCEAVGLEVTGLKRIRIGRLALGDLPPGQWRYLGPFERF